MNGFLLAGPAGQVAFLMAIPLLVIVAGYYGAYVVHSLFVVIEQTAAGFDRVAWPHETFFDWFGKLFHFLVILFVLLFPIGFLLPGLDFDAGPGAALLVASIGFVMIWLVLPVALLSSLSAASRFTLLRWEIVKGLARCLPCVLAFYGITGVLEFLAFGGLYFAVLGWLEMQQAMLLSPTQASLVSVFSLVIAAPIATLFCSTGLLWYARLLGRLGWMLQIVEPHAEGEEEETDSEEEAEAPLDSPAPPAPAEPLPIQLPAPSVITGETYALADEQPPEPTPEPPPFRWQPGRMPTPVPPRSQWRDQAHGPVDRRPDLREEKPEPFVSPRVGYLFEPKIFLFPWYRTTLWAWITISFGILCMTLLARLPVG